MLLAVIILLHLLLSRCFGTAIAAIAIAYGLVFIAGLVGNVLVLIAVFTGDARAMRHHSVTNIFLANLAVADLLVIIVYLPFTLISNIIYRKFHS